MFSEEDLLRIKNVNSRKNFQDVLQAYYSKNYKSSILILYNLLINDLYNKLHIMEENNFYNLKSEVEKIEIKLKDYDKIKFSEIEEDVYNIFVSKKILDSSTINLINYFKKIRNKCAHPSFFKEEDYDLTKEESILFITKIYKDVLIIDIYMKDPYLEMKSDIEDKEWGEILEENIGVVSHEQNYLPLKKYFEIKYYKKMTTDNFKKLFNSLMKLIFYKKNDCIEKGQYINNMVLESLIDYLIKEGSLSIFENAFSWQILKEEVIFDDNKDEFYDNKWFALKYLLNLLLNVRFFVNEIKCSNQILFDYLEQQINTKGDYFILYYEIFHKDLDEAITSIDDNKKTKFYYYVLSGFSEKIGRIKSKKFLNYMFSSIPDQYGYDEADYSCEILIKLIEKFDYKFSELEDILSIMNNNKQIFNRARKKRDSQINELKKLNIDLSSFDNLKVEVAID